MPSNGYQVAHEYAVKEIAEINTEIEKLTHRKNLLEKLVELLKHVDHSSDAVETTARVAAATADETLLERAEFGTPPAAGMSAGNGHSPCYDQVAQLAHHFWTERGHAHGDHEQDWLRAEQELRKTAA